MASGDETPTGRKISGCVATVCSSNNPKTSCDRGVKDRARAGKAALAEGGVDGITPPVSPRA